MFPIPYYLFQNNHMTKDDTTKDKDVKEEKDSAEKIEKAETKTEEQKTENKPAPQEEKKQEKTPEKIEKKEEVEEKKEGKKEVIKTVKDTEPEEVKEVPVPAKFKKIVEEIEKMTVLDLSELVKILEKKLGVSATAPVAVSAVVTPSAGAGAGEEKEEKSVFNIELKDMGDKKIEVIKAVRDITEKGLKEAKDLVDAVANEPQIIKENVKKEEAEEIKKKIEAAGGKVELK